MVTARQLIKRIHAADDVDGDYDRLVRLINIRPDLEGATDEVVREVGKTLMAAKLRQSTKVYVAKELERRKLGDCAEVVKAAASGARGHDLRIHAAALEALAAGSPCVCDVYVAHRPQQRGPLLELVEERVISEKWRTEYDLRCTLCERRLRFTHQSVDRGHDVYEWRHLD